MRKPGASRLDLGADFRRLRIANTVSEWGSAIGAGAVSLVALLVLHASAWQVSTIRAVAAAAGAIVAIWCGPIIEHRRKRPVMVMTDLTRTFALLSIPIADFFGVLSFTQLLLVAFLTSLGGIAFSAAANTHLLNLVGRENRLVAQSRMGSAGWAVYALGSPLGGLLIAAFGATSTMMIDGFSFLASVLGVCLIKAPEPDPPKAVEGVSRFHLAAEGWRFIWGHSTLRQMLLASTAWASSVMMIAPLEVVYMIRNLHFTTWQFGLCMGVPALGGLVGAWLVPLVKGRFSEKRAMLAIGVVRPVGALAILFATPGWPGVVTFMVGDALMLMAAGAFGPLQSTYRMHITPDRFQSRVGVAWMTSKQLITPLFTLLGGLLAAWWGLWHAIEVSLALVMFSALLLPWRARWEASAAENANKGEGCSVSS